MNIRRRVVLTNNAESDFIIMTSATNPKVLKVLYDAGLCASPDIMYKSEAEAVQNSDLSGETKEESLFYTTAKGTKLPAHEDFSAFQYFTGITSIGNRCFGGSFLDKLVLPPTLTYIGSRALAENYFSVISIPASVVTIEGQSIFFSVASGTNGQHDHIVIFEGTAPPAVTYWMNIGLIGNMAAIYVPDGYVDTYKTAWANTSTTSSGTSDKNDWLALIKPISEYQQN